MDTKNLESEQENRVESIDILNTESNVESKVESNTDFNLETKPNNEVQENQNIICNVEVAPKTQEPIATITYNIPIATTSASLPSFISSTYDTLVISGASAKGIIFLGSLQYLYDNYILNHIKTYVGTSIGSIICYLLVIGYTPIEIMVYISTHQLFEKMQAFDILGMVKGKGAFSFSLIQEELEKMSIEKIGYLPTLKSIKERYNKNFISVTYNLTENKTEYLSHENYPDLPCISAIRMSSNLPFVFENYKYGNSFYIDGGISNNFPIDIAQKYGNKILGLGLTHNKEVENKENNIPPNNILEYFYKLIFIPVTQYIELREQQIDIEKTKIIKLNYNGDLKVFNFNISSKNRLEMFSNGYQQIKDIMEK